jgi:hypothetical protein
MQELYVVMAKPFPMLEDLKLASPSPYFRQNNLSRVSAPAPSTLKCIATPTSHPPKLSLTTPFACASARVPVEFTVRIWTALPPTVTLRGKRRRCSFLPIGNHRGLLGDTIRTALTFPPPTCPSFSPQQRAQISHVLDDALMRTSPVPGTKPCCHGQSNSHLKLK